MARLHEHDRGFCGRGLHLARFGIANPVPTTALKDWTNSHLAQISHNSVHLVASVTFVSGSRARLPSFPHARASQSLVAFDFNWRSVAVALGFNPMTEAHLGLLLLFLQ